MYICCSTFIIRCDTGHPLIKDAAVILGVIKSPFIPDPCRWPIHPETAPPLWMMEHINRNPELKPPVNEVWEDFNANGKDVGAVD